MSGTDRSLAGAFVAANACQASDAEIKASSESVVDFLGGAGCPW